MHGRRFTITISGTNEATTASYVTVRTPADGHVWNGSAFEVSNPAHWSTYVFNTTPLGSGLATLTIADSVLPTGADYLFSLYTFTTGGTPASTDTLAGIRKVYNWGPNATGEGQSTSTNGTGNIAVTVNTGGTDNLRFADAGGNGIDGGQIMAYLKSEYDIGGRTARGQVFTRSDGRWAEDMNLNAGTYRFVFERPGYATTSKEQEVA